MCVWSVLTPAVQPSQYFLRVVPVVGALSVFGARRMDFVV